MNKQSIEEAALSFQKAAKAFEELGVALRKIPWYVRWWIYISSWIDEKLGIEE